MECAHNLKTLQEEIQLDWVYAFLAGLDDIFDKVCSDVLRIQPLPSVEEVFFVVKCEAQRHATMMGGSNAISQGRVPVVVMVSWPSVGQTCHTECVNNGTSRGCASLAAATSSSTKETELPSSDPSLSLLTCTGESSSNAYIIIGRGSKREWMYYVDDIIPGRANACEVCIIDKSHRALFPPSMNTRFFLGSRGCRGVNGAATKSNMEEFQQVSADNRIGEFRQANVESSDAQQQQENTDSGSLVQQIHAESSPEQFAIAESNTRPSNFDVKNVFLHGNMEEEVYMDFPPGYDADDMIISGDDFNEIVKLQENLVAKFEIKNLGDLKYFLGVEVAHSTKAKNPVQHDRMKHVEVDRNFIKEKLEKKIVSIPFVNSEEQLADFLTHAVCSRKFDDSLIKLGMCDIYAPT
ncbi:hypothetical protein D8674_010274 [Pyrus ussuriensis x Pyrus communis]|uniref:Reverse transcriptase Ty1/copia-type domain-containing protein n=1 Tax=Pyrus ussuriensis x Pyrus communis TaxID=2448454 RepID=A0A5N5FB11_9ROSA|nr:hypothetical protein D8674_010274 [Pyrus ussuriensis x Pyrus communis]